MKAKSPLIIIFIILAVSTPGNSRGKHFQHIPLLFGYVKQDRYSDLYSELAKNRAQYTQTALLFYDGILKSVLNKPEESNQLIGKFRRAYSNNDDTTNYFITQAEYNNYLKLCNYKKLKDLGSELISKYNKFIDSSDYVELQDDHVRYTVLEHEKPITVRKRSDTKLIVHKDLAGYTLLPVKSSNDSTVNFVFDTGANVNAITESSAKKLCLRILPDSKIYVMGATGMRNEARIGIAESITIGTIEIHHAEFVIFADSLFTFAGGKYIIHGAVGFPIMSRFEEIWFEDSTLSIPRIPALKSGEPNMFIKSDDYILSVEYQRTKYPFFFDTGNDKTYFTKNFYDLDLSLFTALPDTLYSYGGVGGTDQVKAKRADTVTVYFSGQPFPLVHPLIETEYGHIDKNLYGSIGKDFVACYKKRIMSFKEARFEFQ